MQSNKSRLANEIKKKIYIDNYIDKWLKMEALDKPYVKCEICGYTSNACIHQHLLVPEELGSDSGENRIIHLCANCNDELRTLIYNYQSRIVTEEKDQVHEMAFEKLKDKKKHYREMNERLERIEV